MCMFSRPVVSVSQTNIFARHGAPGRQFIVYSLKLGAREDVAMVLPIPVRPRSGETAVRFINLEGYPRFFEDLHTPFDPVALSGGGFGGARGSGLAVVDVGSFEASYVPTVRDFDRLDPRFRLPEGTWNALPQYARYGFAVF